MNSEQQQYIYLLHGTSDESPETLEDIFNNGLISYSGNSMYSTMTPITHKQIKEFGLEDIIKNYTIGEFKTTFLIKVPVNYMASVIHRGGNIYFPLPVWKQEEQKDYYGRDISRFTPHLIQGAYNVTTNTFITNTNYTPAFDPSGYQYSEEQIRNLGNLGKMDWYNYAKERNKFTFKQLYDVDKQRETFDNLVQQYEVKLGRKVPVQFDSTNYRMNLDKASSFGNVHQHK